MSIPVPEQAVTAVKTVMAVLGSLLTFGGILVTTTSDGMISAADVGTISTGGATLVASVLAVWYFRNKPKDQ